MCFMLDALASIRIGGVIAAILPAGIIDRDADQPGWDLIRSCSDVRVLSPRQAHDWPCEVEVVFAVVRKIHEISLGKAGLEIKQCNGAPSGKWRVVRGGVRNQKSRVCSQSGLPFIHTTNMIDGELVGLKLIETNGKSVISGPGILIPRVGVPNVRKVTNFELATDAVISDCVFFVSTNSAKSAKKLREQIAANWASFETAYLGSCARHITRLRLEKLLNELRV
jgi:hypothetical protein